MTIDIQQLVQEETQYFDSLERIDALRTHLVTPEAVQQGWDYSAATHTCTIIAKNQIEQIVYCPTGFGPSFPWSCQRIGESILGMDSAWCAYLYECVVGSSMSPTVPDDFELKGPGERSPTFPS